MTPRRSLAPALFAATMLFVAPHRGLSAQQPSTTDSVRLGPLHGDALRHDPRARQADLLARQTNLRLRSIDAERLPSVNVFGQGQYQSVVISPIVPTAPGAVPLKLPHDTYDAQLNTRVRLYDPSLGSRRAIERAQLGESQARLRASLYTLTQSVN